MFVLGIKRRFAPYFDVPEAGVLNVFLTSAGRADCPLRHPNRMQARHWVTEANEALRPPS